MIASILFILITLFANVIAEGGWTVQQLGMFGTLIRKGSRNYMICMTISIMMNVASDVWRSW